MQRPHSSKKQLSSLVTRFVERAGCSDSVTPEEAILDLIRRTASNALNSVESRLTSFLSSRNVRDIHISPTLGCDGLIEPLGHAYADGFRIELKQSAPETRRRFTLAHEVCHTFFYELVPELKFTPHRRDATEEHVCNCGAAELLVPAASIRHRAATLEVTLESLDALAAEYHVSVPMLLLRLRDLGLSNCELSFWRRTDDGVFVFDKIYGRRRDHCEWDDSGLPARIWRTRGSLAGRGLLAYTDDRGTRRFRPVTFQARRWATGIAALWDIDLESARRQSESTRLF